MATNSAADVVHNSAEHRFELPIENDAMAAAYYRIDRRGRLVMTHTEVPGPYEGRGLASMLARGLFEIARKEHFRLVLLCPFLRSWYARHPEYADVVEEQPAQ